MGQVEGERRVERWDRSREREGREMGQVEGERWDRLRERDGTG